MTGDKIISIDRGQRPTAVPPSELPQLIGDPARAHGMVAFLDVTILHQESFLTILSRNPVTAIIDIRDVPVFEKPHFRHAEVADYLLRRRIAYLDLTSYSVRNAFAEAHVNLLASQPHQLIGRIAQILDSGLTLITHDGSTLRNSLINDLRRLFAHHTSFRAEIHPSALSR
jgi:hypothetical protein